MIKFTRPFLFTYVLSAALQRDFIKASEEFAEFFELAERGKSFTNYNQAAFKKDK